MAISTLKNRESYESGANQTSFDFTVSGVRVPFFANSDIKVFKRASGETADTELTFNASPSSNAQFSITAVNNDTRQGGTIVLGGTGYAAGTTITIERVVPFTQEYTLQEGSAIDPTALNTALDRTVAQTQQLDDDRSVTFPASDASSVTYNITESAASRASKVLGFDSSGNVNTQTFSSVAGDAVSGGDGIDITANNISVDVTSDFTFSSGELALATDSVDTTEIKANAVDTAEIKDSAVTEAKIGNNAVTASKIAGNAVGSAQISDGAVTSSELAGNAVSLATMAQMAQNTVIGRITSGTGNPEHIANGINDPTRNYHSTSANTTSNTTIQNDQGRPMWVSFAIEIDTNDGEITSFKGEISPNSDMSSAIRIAYMEGDPDGNEHHGATLNMIVPASFYYRFVYTTSHTPTTMLHSQFVL